jgi:tetratricopeptide (TPR) repeat protein
MELRSALASGAVTGASAAEEARKLLERAPEVPATTRAGAGLLLAEALLAIDDAAGAAAAARHAIELGASTGQRPVVAEGEVVLGAALLRAGDHEGALEAAERARRQFADLGEVSGLSRVGLLRGEAAAATGDLAAARSALEEAGRYAERGRVTRLVRRVEERRAELGSSGPATGGDARA